MRKFWIDCDTGVDDAIAILMVLSDPDVDVIGISTVAGNTIVANATQNTLRVLRLANRLQIPVHQGADKSILGNCADSWYHGSDGLGDVPDVPAEDLEGGAQDLRDAQDIEGIKPATEHAAIAMANAVKAQPGSVSLLMLGPLTNLALATHLVPDISQQIEHCYVMGGNYSGEGNISIGAEFNFHCDPEAAHIVLNGLQCPMTITCWETCLKTGIPLETFHQLETMGTRRSEFFRQITKHGQKICDEIFTQPDDPRQSHHVYADSVAAAVALDTTIVRKSKQRRVKMELSGTETRGQMIVDWRGRFLTDTPERTLVLGLHREPYLGLLRKALQ